MDELPEIFTRINIQILRLLMDEKLHLREIAQRIKCSPAKVHACIKIFRKNNIITEVQDRNRKVIALNPESELASQIIGLLGADANAGMSITPRKANLFDMISPLDFRYYGTNSDAFPRLQPYLSETGFVRHALKVEAALAGALADYKLCPREAAEEIKKACSQVNPEEVYAEEGRIKHNVRALVNCIRKRVSPGSMPYVHFTATSYDIIATADALRYKKFGLKVLIPELKALKSLLAEIAMREKDTLQIGRTHGQHAEPITFGFAMAQYASRLEFCIVKIRNSAANLRGKMAGAVGAYNASSLFFDDPVRFEESVLGRLGLEASPISTQVVQPEYLLDYLNGIASAFGVLANLADDMRHLQRSEIAEVGEFFEARQVGSSTMPQKRNPINFENVKSMWKEFMPRIMTMYMDQISEHQRDLTNSASMRFVPELLAGFYVSAARLRKVMSKMAVDRKNMRKNFDMSRQSVIAEPLYILLASSGHPNAHEYVRGMTLKAQAANEPLISLVKKDKPVQEYLKKFTRKQLDILENPEKYTGISSRKTEEICGKIGRN